MTAANSVPTPEAAALAEALKFLGHDAREGHSSTLALLELQRIKPDPMTLAQLIDRVEQNARRSLAAIDDFMDLARARTQEMRIEELDLVDLLVEVVADGWAMASRQGVRVQVAPGPEVIVGCADRELLTSALAKLLRDVVAKAPRGVDVTCALRELEDGGWALEIVDPVGESPSETDSTAKEPRRGNRAAPGLQLAQAVADRHGGRMQVDSDPDRGQTYRMVLPARSEPSETVT